MCRSSFTADVEIYGRPFSFVLHRRRLELGPAGEVSYFWMDDRRFRRGDGGPNFRRCVDLWWHVVEHAGNVDDPVTQVTRVWAECYPLVNTARSLQDVYLDAHLHRNADLEYRHEEVGGRRQRIADRLYTLPEEEANRLRGIAHSRNADLVRQELEALFLGELPPEEEMPAYREAARRWIDNGVLALRRDGVDGLRQYVPEIGRWIGRYRRRGNDPGPRAFINLFGYQAKVSFYLCFANAWSGLIPWLREHQGLDAMGERFMQYWHHQNQPQIAEGLPEVARDTLYGQTLSLHPLSAVVMNDPYYLNAIGRWISHPHYSDLMGTDRVGTCSEYWDFIAAILLAAHEYRHIRDTWEERRGTYTEGGDAAERRMVRDDADVSVATLFQDYASRVALTCTDCGDPFVL